MDNVSTPSVTRKKQLRNLGILMGVVIAGFMAFIYLASDSSSPTANEANLKADFANPLDHVDVESVVLEKAQKQLKEADKKTEDLQKQIDSIVNEKKEEAGKETGKNELLKRIDALEQQLRAPVGLNLSGNSSPGGTPIAGSQEFQSNFVPPLSGSNNVQNSYSGDSGGGQGIREDNLTLSPSNVELENHVPLKNPDTYVPAGAFVKAVTLGGADASAAVNAQANPSPMLFRIIESGTLPNHKKSHLKDCIVTAAAVGDISSEKGEIRLESLSCTFPSNEIVDQTVEGTVFGPNGVNGVRGHVHEGGGERLTNAVLSGAAGGISKGISETYTTNSVSTLGNISTTKPSKVFQNGFASGGASGFDYIAKYEMTKAEQYHPVIQLSAGTIVDIVFIKGFFLDGKKHENQDASVVNYSAQSQATPNLFPLTHDESQTLPLSPDAVKRIQEHSKELGLKVSTQQTES
jgi:conjugal transfer pilus assembly protein TraB